MFVVVDSSIYIQYSSKTFQHEISQVQTAVHSGLSGRMV